MISPRAPVIGLPTLRLSSWASSSVLRLDQRRELGQRPAALAGGPGRPALAIVERAPGRLDRPVDVRRSAERRRGDDLPGRRIDDVERLAVGGIDGLAADDHPGPDRRLVGTALERRLLVGCHDFASRGAPGWLGRGRCRVGGIDGLSAATIAAPMIPASLRSCGRDDLAVHGQPRDVLVGALADPAAEDHQVRPHQLLDPVEVLVEVRSPRPSTTARA